jgi:hypothetical protein
LEAGQGKSMRLYLKKHAKRTKIGGVPQVVEHLPSNLKALSSIFSIGKWGWG